MNNPPHCISIVLVTFQRSDWLRRCIVSLRSSANSCPHVRIRLLVRINGEDTASESVLHELGVVFESSARRITPAAVRNLLVSQVQDDWVYFIDDDAYVDDDFFAKFCSFYEAVFNKGEAVFALGGPNLTPSCSNYFQKSLGAALASRFATFNSVGRYRQDKDIFECDERSLILCNLFLPKEFLKKNFFPEHFICGEENWLLKDFESAGLKMFYDSKLFVWHERRNNLPSLFRQVYLYGVGRAILILSKQNSFKISYLLPSLCILYLTLASVLALAGFIPMLAVSTPVLIYLLLSLGFGFVAPERTFLTPAIFVIIHTGYGLGFLVGLKKKIKEIRVSFPLFIALWVFLLSLSIFIFRISQPEHPIFDEENYVSAARQFLLVMGTNENWTHPPGAKLLIGLGIKIWGDNPLGWRCMSCLFGSVTLTGIYVLATELFESLPYALAVTLLCLVNQVLFVHARIAMLEIFWFCFSLWATVFFIQSSRYDRYSRQLLVISSILFGLAISCKWSALMPTLICFLFLAKDIFNRRKVLSRRFESIAFFTGPLGIIYFCVNLVLGVMHHPTYALPLTLNRSLYTTWDVVRLQWAMLTQNLNVNYIHQSITSPWWSWPLILKPIWYYESAHQIEFGAKIIKAIGYLGNPLIAWSGIGCVFYFVISKSTSRRGHLGLILSLFIGQWLLGILLSLRTNYYYYYFGSEMFLPFFIVWVYDDCRKRFPKARLQYLAQLYLLGAIGVFLFFYPVLTAIPLSASHFERRIWLGSWKPAVFSEPGSHP